MPDPDVQSRETPRWTPARLRALRRAASSNGYAPYGAEWPTARLLLDHNLIGPRISRRFRLTDQGRAVLDDLDQRARLKTLRPTDAKKAKERAYARAYRARNRERIAKRKREFNDRHPEKLRAQHKVAKALRAGRLIRPSTCSACGEPGLIEAHHDDYDKPLDVIWLCTSCHAAHERRNQRGRAA